MCNVSQARKEHSRHEHVRQKLKLDRQASLTCGGDIGGNNVLEGVDACLGEVVENVSTSVGWIVRRLGTHGVGDDIQCQDNGKAFATTKDIGELGDQRLAYREDETAGRRQCCQGGDLPEA